MLGLKASHASWELKGLLLLPGKSLLGGGERSPEWGLAKPVPFLLLIPSVGGGAVLASASGCDWAENSAGASPSHLETAQEVSFISQRI